MRTNRRRFLEISSTLGALLPAGRLVPERSGDTFLERISGSEQENQKRRSTPFLASPFKDLEGWTSRGDGRWKVADGEIVANGEGWLALNQGLEDFIFRFDFRSERGEVGIILRNAPTDWSRFSHPSGAAGNTAGLYIELTGNNAGAISLVTLEKQGKVLESHRVPGPPAFTEPKRIDGACAPVACVGINHPFGTLTGYPPEPLVQIKPAKDGWKSVEIALRGPALPWDKTGLAKVADQRSQFGEIALHVTGPGATARFKELSIFDLTERVAGIAANQGVSRVRQLTDLFYSEGVAAADLNGDGYDEVIAGPFYYLGPDFGIAREIFPPTTVNPGGQYELGNYSNTFLVHAHDFRGDGWPDIVMIMGFGPMPNFSAYLFVNPRGQLRHWDNYLIVPSVSAETTVLADVDGDGHPELVLSQDDQIGYAKPDLADPAKPWKFIAVSEKGNWGPHGFGVGDVNADGRMDILQASGWWEQPPAGTAGLWKFHPAPFGATEGEWFLRGGANIMVYDVNGDGVPDVISSLNAHGPGLAWFEQQRDAAGSSTWKRHLIMGDPGVPPGERGDWEEDDKSVAFTELHALALADLDGDGMPCIVTGKRWWSHGYIYDENQIDNPPVLYRFKLDRRSKDSVRWIPALIHNASGVGTQILAKDVNKDGKVEIITCARKGTFIFFSGNGKS